MDQSKAWLIQQERMEYYKKNSPDLVTKKTIRPEGLIFDEIGITNISKDKPIGYSRLFLEDFIVEEKRSNNATSRITDLGVDSDLTNEDEDQGTLYANLIKIGIPTSFALERISKILDIPQNKIGFAGLKDAEAITAQQISFPRIRLSVREITEHKISNLHLSDFHYGKGSLNPGSLEGNIFTITIRTKIGDEGRYEPGLNAINQYGVLNYFQSQRFGGFRLLSHKLGRLVMRGEYEEAVKYFLFKSSEDDIELIKQIRNKANDSYPDWIKMIEIYSELPYLFGKELQLLGYLEKDNNNFIGALIEIKDQTQLWIYAYGSWLFNKYLSDYSRTKGCRDEKFPIILSASPNEENIYWKYLKEDGTGDYRRNLFPFKFIQYKTRLIPGKIYAKDVKAVNFAGGVVIRFTLPKASYATTFLTNIFELCQGLPIPEWVNLTEVDPLELLGEGNIKNVKEVFKDSWYSKLDNMI